MELCPESWPESSFGFRRTFMIDLTGMAVDGAEAVVEVDPDGEAELCGAADVDAVVKAVGLGCTVTLTLTEEDEERSEASAESEVEEKSSPPDEKEEENISADDLPPLPPPATSFSCWISSFTTEKQKKNKNNE